jgi:hypothetical protein
MVCQGRSSTFDNHQRFWGGARTSAIMRSFMQDVPRVHILHVLFSPDIPSAFDRSM